MDHIAFPYRSASHLALLHVIAESGAWEKYGLDVAYNQRIARADAAALEIDPSIIVDNVEAPSVAAGKLLDMLRSHGIASVI